MWLSASFCDFHETSNHIEKVRRTFNYSRESSSNRRRADGTGNEFLPAFQLDTLALIINFVVVRLYWRFGRLGN